MNKKLRYLLLMLLLAVFNLSGFADEFTFQQNSKNSGTLTNAQLVSRIHLKIREVMQMIS